MTGGGTRSRRVSLRPTFREAETTVQLWWQHQRYGQHNVTLFGMHCLLLERRHDSHFCVSQRSFERRKVFFRCCSRYAVRCPVEVLVVVSSFCRCPEECGGFLTQTGWKASCLDSRDAAQRTWCGDDNTMLSTWGRCPDRAIVASWRPFCLFVIVRQSLQCIQYTNITQKGRKKHTVQ